jgi:hypothetical protein
MHAFLIELDNAPGALARVAEAIAAKDVNITAVAGATCGEAGRAAITTADEALTPIALAEARCSFTELEVTETTIRHEPGSLATACSRLAEAGINIEAVLPMGMAGEDVQIGFVTSDPAKAREALAIVGMTSR